MAIRPIVRYPDTRLRERCVEIRPEEIPQLSSLIRDMGDTMYASEGAGLAAIQVGVAKQLYIVDPEVAGRAATDHPVVFINPKIIWLSDEKETTDEGCLSFPGIFVPIERSLRCTTQALGSDAAPFELTGEGLLARAMQHEYDHLTGKVLVDYVGRMKRRMIERRLLREDESDAGLNR